MASLIEALQRVDARSHESFRSIPLRSRGIHRIGHSFVHSDTFPFHYSSSWRSYSLTDSIINQCTVFIFILLLRIKAAALVRERKTKTPNGKNPLSNRGRNKSSQDNLIIINKGKRYFQLGCYLTSSAA